MQFHILISNLSKVENYQAENYQGEILGKIRSFIVSVESTSN